MENATELVAEETTSAGKIFNIEYENISPSKLSSSSYSSILYNTKKKE